MKKHLSITQAYFELPEDFEGGIAEALRLMADYIDEPTKPIEDAPEGTVFKNPYRAYEDVLARGGKLLSTGMSVQFLKEDHWENQPQGAGWISQSEEG